jgi:hypothetical protein
VVGYNKGTGLSLGKEISMNPLFVYNPREEGLNLSMIREFGFEEVFYFG